MVTKDPPLPEGALSSPEWTQLLSPVRAERWAEGGLRTKGYFKRGFPGKPLVTVVTIVYNRARYMAATVQSVLAQTYDNVEYIVIDGGSTDGTLDVITRLEHAIDYWVSERDEGISDAFNKGIAASTGEWLNFMNCGDVFASPGAVQDVVRHVDDKADIVFGLANVVDSDGRVLLTCGGPYSEKEFRRRMMTPHQSVFHNRRYFEQYGLFDKQLKIIMDYELLLRKKPLSAVFIGKAVSNMLIGGATDTLDYLRLRTVRMIRRRYCPELGDLTIEFHYWYGLARALAKRALNSLGLRRVTRRIRQMRGRSHWRGQA
jgi:glycosyltransferase involved in cell wall biosynthesis